jgi:hypothetical protein
MIHNILESFDSSGNNTADNKQVVDLVSKIFHNSLFKLLIAFVVIYLVVFVFFGMFLRDSSGGSVNIMFDFAVIAGIGLFALYKYIVSSDQTKSNVLKGGVQGLVDYIEDPLSLFTTVLFVVCFYLVVFMFRISTTENTPVSVAVMGTLGWVSIGVLVIHNALKYLFNVDLVDIIRDPTWGEIDMNGDLPEIDLKIPEVFNISNNLYTYEDSQAICKAYDSRLATYDEIETAYNNGAEWCNYGWSDNQMAFFPTQKQTWTDLQVSEKTKNNCGRPGVNGGYFANKNIKFGVNCYGVKPNANKNEANWKDAANSVPFPQTDDNKKMDEQVKYWKDNMEKSLHVSSFNKDKWSRF